VRVPGSALRPPGGVAGCQCLPHLGGTRRRAPRSGCRRPGRKPPRARMSQSGIRTRRRGYLFAREAARRHAQLARLRASAGVARARPAEPPAPPEQVAILTGATVRPATPLERRDSRRRTSAARAPLGPAARSSARRLAGPARLKSARRAMVSRSISDDGAGIVGPPPPSARAQRQGVEQRVALAARARRGSAMERSG